MNMKRFVTALIIFLCAAQLGKAQLLPSFGDSRIGTTGFQFLKIAPDARSVGMATSYIAVVNDVSAVYWNPAGLTKTDTFDFNVMAGHTAYYGNTTLNHLAASYKIGTESYLGFGLVYFNSGIMDVTTEYMPFGTGQTFRAVDVALGLSFAQALTESFSFGATAKYVFEGIAGININTVVFDFGFQYDVGLANTRFAVSMNNFGFNATPQGTIEVDKGNGPETVDNFEQVSTPSVFRLGIAWDPIKKDKNLLTLSAQLNHPTDNNETLGIGTEYVWNNLLFLRAGYLIGEDETGLPYFGFGLKLKRRFGALLFDYGFNNKSRLGIAHKFSIGVSL
jgi:Type IX secretion system protein PorV